jgi:hypothetical protein
MADLTAKATQGCPPNNGLKENQFLSFPFFSSHSAEPV